MGSLLYGTVDDTTPDSAPESGTRKVRCTPTGDLHVTLYDSSGTEQDLVAYLIGTPTGSVVAQSASSGTLLAANASRKDWRVYNDSDATLYIDEEGGTASTANATFAVAPRSASPPFNMVGTGLITCIWGAAGSGNAYVCEFE